MERMILIRKLQALAHSTVSKVLIGFALTAMIYTACKKPFEPEAIKGFNSALIVEGVLNTAGETNITLSRTLDLDDKVGIRPELKAVVQVLAENNSAVNLTEKGNGVYTIPQLTFNPSQKYRLKIRTANGSEYMSDPMTVKVTPAIDSINWVRNTDGVTIYANTHDPQNKTRYYQWDVDEDWEIRSIGTSEFKLIPGTRPNGPLWELARRDAAEIPLMNICYKYQRSTNILITSTAKLNSDVVSRFPLVNIPNNSDKLSVRYSLLVRQYAIDFENFEYLSMMKRNSEQLGSFFDAQPTELIGNIKNVTDPDDIAIGYMGIASVLQKRIFITRDQVPSWRFSLSCKDLNVPRDSLEYYFGPGRGNLISTTGADSPTGGAATYLGSSEQCLDCRERGGNNNKPVFW